MTERNTEYGIGNTGLHAEGVREAQEPVGSTAKRLRTLAQVWRLCGTLGIHNKYCAALTCPPKALRRRKERQNGIDS